MPITLKKITPKAAATALRAAHRAKRINQLKTFVSPATVKRWERRLKAEDCRTKRGKPVTVDMIFATLAGKLKGKGGVESAHLDLETHEPVFATVTVRGKSSTVKVAGFAGLVGKVRLSGDDVDRHIYARWISHPFWQHVNRPDLTPQELMSGERWGQ